MVPSLTRMKRFAQFTGLLTNYYFLNPLSKFRNLNKMSLASYVALSKGVDRLPYMVSRNITSAALTRVKLVSLEPPHKLQ